ncbi:uncharacterized protein LOC110020929 isoform X2 [Phalaenopsis equestris]|uniref:uncharacterized protein LOC110020929 isoform X2 n=1 Tax=Phalaenopsis equestris TaxID=78828 RepID=UPI0009E4455E|nr:uncharacterized protein LOC110020929 isoform X2 [Phalaenopsis equestris]
MASSLFFKRPCTLILILFLSVTICCKSEEDAMDIVTEAMACFNDPHLYSTCQESYRLKAEGRIVVPAEAVDDYCGGPCLQETKLVLQCLHNILSNFRFYNGATLLKVGQALERGCSHDENRVQLRLQVISTHWRISSILA